MTNERNAGTMYCPDGVHKENVEMQSKGQFELLADVKVERYVCSECGTDFLFMVNFKE